MQAYEALGESLEKIGTLDSNLVAKGVYEKMTFVEPGCKCWEKVIQSTKDR